MVSSEEAFCNGTPARDEWSSCANGTRSARNEKSLLDEDPDDVRTALQRLVEEAPRVSLEDGTNTKPGLFELPPWFDAERYKRGAQTFENNRHVMFSCKLAGLVTLLAIPSILRVLIFTRKSNEAAKAFRRYIDTVRHMMYWYRSDLTDPNSPGRESLQAVRAHHLHGSSSAKRSGMGNFSQFDMAVTQFAFCGFVVLHRRLLYIHATEDELLDFLHFWRTIGFLVGIRDEFNVCAFDKDIRRSDRLFSGVCSRVLAPAMLSPPEDFWSMSYALLIGLWNSLPVLEYDSFIRYTQELSGVPEAALHPLKSAYSRFISWMLGFVPYAMTLPVVGPWVRAYYNGSILFSIYMSTHYPLLAWYSFPGDKITRYHRLIKSAD